MRSLRVLVRYAGLRSATGQARALRIRTGPTKAKERPHRDRKPTTQGPEAAMKAQEMKAQELSVELRDSLSEVMEKRRGVVGLSLAAAGAMGLIALYQTGIIKHLPDVPLPYFDADKVDAAPQAYEKLSMPDAVLGFGSYAATMALAAMGGEERAKEHPWLPIALAAKVGFDALQAGKLSVDQWTKHRAFCVWCLTAAGATFAAVPLVLPEARAALRQLTQ
jgi:uncharacterized membrane protein